MNQNNSRDGWKLKIRDWWYSAQEFLIIKDAELNETRRVDLEHIVYQELQKVRKDWLREEINKLRGWQMKVPTLERHWQSQLNYENAKTHNQALQTIIDHYQSELDQPNK